MPVSGLDSIKEYLIRLELNPGRMPTMAEYKKAYREQLKNHPDKGGVTALFNMLKSAIKTAKVWQFVDVATKLLTCCSFYPRKKGWIKLPRSALLMALLKTALFWQVSSSV